MILHKEAVRDNKLNIGTAWGKFPTSNQLTTDSDSNHSRIQCRDSYPSYTHQISDENWAILRKIRFQRNNASEDRPQPHMLPS